MGGKAQPGLLWWLVGYGVLGLLVLLLWDLVRLLRWIARSPLEAKKKTGFLDSLS